MRDDTKPEVLQRMESFTQKLKDLGIDPEKFGQIKDLVLEHGSMSSDLEEYRQTQFWDDARELIYNLSTVGRNDKTAYASKSLREFAEHIASHVIGQEGSMRDLVDRIPPMYQPVEIDA